MCEIACQVRHDNVWSTFVANLMIAELGFCHGGSLGSRAERVMSTGHETLPALTFASGISPQPMVRSSRLFGGPSSKRPAVLDHAENEINILRGGVTTVDGGRKNARIVLLAGAGESPSPKEAIDRR